MRIQEVADRLGTTARAIRLYEQKGLLQPHKDADNGYRRYTESDVDTLRRILAMRELGMSLATIAGLLSASGRTAEWADHLEAARASLYRQHLAAAQGLQALDGVIAALEQRSSVPEQAMLDAAEHLRESRLLRESWQDRWDYDDVARRMEQEKGLPLAFPVDDLSESAYEQTLDVVATRLAARPGELGVDLGTGLGNLTGRLAAAGADIVGIEQSTEMLRACRQRYPQLSFRLGNLLALPLPDHTADFVACSFAFHHLTSRQQRLALQEIDRILRPNGRLCLAGLTTAVPCDAATTDDAPWYPIDTAGFMTWCAGRGLHGEFLPATASTVVMIGRPLSV
ncbi:hypothetical protein PA598K_01093 [Paenibacillus sp. 598K]|uniref:MerR family transcriptional regulator n=1 Tax=Paenibacillus sp. 598K TaxID=1117987 RepID=UPI000FF91A31|nr:methyltransferase domain-containing protein [Paenibacillus sp. 598K]GBF72824.1 hypothetical protein PA598K_01093 [Paenibacillus sp. 598K]